MVSPHLLIEHVAPTAEKAAPVNEQTDLLDRALNQHVVIDVSAGGQIVLTETQIKQNMLLRLTGTPGGAFELILPTNERIFAVHNQVSDGSVCTLGVAVTDGTWDTCAALERAIFHCDGENCIKLATTVLGTPIGLVEAFSGFIEVPTEKTYVLEQHAKYAYNINELTGICVAGSLDVTIAINGTPVTGLNSVTHNTSESTDTATALFAVAVGDTITLVVDDLDTDTAEDFSFSMKTTRL